MRTSVLHVKKNSSDDFMKKSAILKNNLLLFGVIVFVFLQIVDYIMWRRLGIINSRLFLGLIGNNFLAIVISAILIIFLFCFYKKRPSADLFFLMIIPAGISNISDRFIYGGAVDYLSVNKFPVFNIADVFITCGVVLLLGSVLREVMNIKNP